MEEIKNESKLTKILGRDGQKIKRYPQRTACSKALKFIKKETK